MKQSFSSPDINISVKIRTPKINLELMISYKNTSVFDQHDMNSLIIPVQVCRKIEQPTVLYTGFFALMFFSALLHLQTVFLRLESIQT